MPVGPESLRVVRPCRGAGNTGAGRRGRARWWRPASNARSWSGTAPAEGQMSNPHAPDRRQRPYFHLALSGTLSVLKPPGHAACRTAFTRDADGRHAAMRRQAVAGARRGPPATLDTLRHGVGRPRGLPPSDPNQTPRAIIAAHRPGGSTPPLGTNVVSQAWIQVVVASAPV